jgi:hypothetical protein
MLKYAARGEQSSGRGGRRHLESGGRPVAIVGRGMASDFGDWWKRISV